MKVLVLIEQGASSRYWEASLPLLRQKGIDAALATVKSCGELHKNLTLKDVPNYSLDTESSRDYPTAARKLARLVRVNRFEVIHACESIPAFIAGLSILWGNPARRVFNRQHNFAVGKQRLLSFIGSQMSHLVMPVSKSSGESAQLYDKIKSNKIKIAYSGIEMMRSVHCDEIRELKSKLGIPKDARIVSMVAHLREEKGHRVLLEACQIISLYLDGPLHVVFVGSGDYEAALREAARQATNFTTHFVGHQRDVALWFSAADVIAMPSYHEAFGLSAAEAMSCGRPLVASNVGGLAEIIEDGKSGILVPPKDIKALGEAVLRVLTQPDLARRLGENARKRVEKKFTIEKMVEGWIECYSRVSMF